MFWRQAALNQIACSDKKKQISFLCNTMTFVASKIEYGAIADEVQLSELQRDALL